MTEAHNRIWHAYPLHNEELAELGIIPSEVFARSGLDRDAQIREATAAVQEPPTERAVQWAIAHVELGKLSLDVAIACLRQTGWASKVIKEYNVVCLPSGRIIRI